MTALYTMTLEQLGRHVVTLAKWRWMPGMLYRHRNWPSDLLWRVVESTLDGSDPEVDWEPDLSYPDLSDPATLGCLLVLVREAWGNSRLYAEWYIATTNHMYERLPAGWTLYVAGTPPLTIPSRLPTEAHALVAALEAAP